MSAIYLLNKKNEDTTPQDLSVVKNVNMPNGDNIYN